MVNSVIIEKFPCLVGKEEKIVSIHNFQNHVINIKSIKLKLLDFNCKELSRFAVLRLSKEGINKISEHIKLVFYNDIDIKYRYTFKKLLMLNEDEQLCIYTVAENKLSDKSLPNINIDKNKTIVKIECDQ